MAENGRLRNKLSMQMKGHQKAPPTSAIPRISPQLRYYVIWPFWRFCCRFFLVIRLHNVVPAHRGCRTQARLTPLHVLSSLLFLPRVWSWQRSSSISTRSAHVRAKRHNPATSYLMESGATRRGKGSGGLSEGWRRVDFTAAKKTTTRPV